MWLINRETYALEYYHDPPAYLILSHTWGNDEVSFQDIQDLDRAQKMKGFRKIKGICEVSLSPEVRHVWVDTCCIDKSSSAELTESINSMFRWYKEATCCVVYLEDLEPATDRASTPASSATEEDLRPCRWLRRGWTLQELIAPSSAYFYDASWKLRGNKQELVDSLSNITKIDKTTLLDANNVHNVLIARRMSWAAGRSTTRIEDQAYSLLGIFGVHMPLIYGEREKAFLRLQLAIVQNHPDDLSLFAWSFPPSSTNTSNSEGADLFATEPSFFRLCSSLEKVRDATIPSPDIVVTNRVIEVTTGLPLHPALLPDGVKLAPRGEELLLLNCRDPEFDNHVVAVIIRITGPVFVRDGKADLVMLDPLAIRFRRASRLKILQDAHRLSDSQISLRANPWRFFHSLENNDSRLQQLLVVDVLCYPRQIVKQDTSLRDTVWEFATPQEDEHLTTVMEVRLGPARRAPGLQPSRFFVICGLTEPTGGRNVNDIKLWSAILLPDGTEGGPLSMYHELSTSFNEYTLSTLGQRLRLIYSTKPKSALFCPERQLNVYGHDLNISIDVGCWQSILQDREVDGKPMVQLKVKVEMFNPLGKSEKDSESEKNKKNSESEEDEESEKDGESEKGDKSEKDGQSAVADQNATDRTSDGDNDGPRTS